MSRSLLLKLTAVSIGLIISISLAEVFLRVQTFIELEGFAEQNPWNSVLHHGDGQFVIADYGENCTTPTTRVLLLGDSWMEDPVLSGTIGRELSLKSGTCVQTVNGGTSSYSPTIYLLRGRQAFEKFGAFDYVIVNIDETDIGDEWLRYRIPLTRDLSGRIIAVPYEKDIRSVFLWNGKLWAEDSPSYFIRFLKFAFFYNVLVPGLDNFTVATNHYETLMRYVFSPEAATDFVQEQEYFYHRIQEMAAEMAGFSAGARRSVFVTHHPHLRGLVSRTEEGKRYLPVVSEAVARLGREVGVHVLDARNHIAEIHGDDFLVNTYVAGDPYSHLASEGAARYGKWIAAQIVRSKE